MVVGLFQSHGIPCRRIVIAKSTINNRRSIIILDLINTISVLWERERHFAHEAYQEIEFLDPQFNTQALSFCPCCDGIVEERDRRIGGGRKTFDLEILEIVFKFGVKRSGTSQFGETNRENSVALFCFQYEDVSETTSGD